VALQEGARGRLAALAALMGEAGAEFAAGLKLSNKETAEILKISAALRRG